MWALVVWALVVWGWWCGLGLSLVRAVVAAHDGTVSLRSVPGDTEIVVVLPR